jgi:hypothetical protein
MQPSQSKVRIAAVLCSASAGMSARSASPGAARARLSAAEARRVSAPVISARRIAASSAPGATTRAPAWLATALPMSATPDAAANSSAPESQDER